MATPVDHGKKLCLLMNALAESTASLSDERLLKEAEGENLTKIAEGTRKLLFATLDRARKARLE